MIDLFKANKKDIENLTDAEFTNVLNNTKNLAKLYMTDQWYTIFNRALEMPLSNVAKNNPNFKKAIYEKYR